MAWYLSFKFFMGRSVPANLPNNEKEKFNML